MSEEGEWMGNNIPKFSVLHHKPESMPHHLCLDITELMDM